MKKKLLALVLVMAMLLSCMLMLTSCPDEDTPGGGGETPAGDGELNLDEGVGKGEGSSDITVVTDPNSDSAGAKEEDKYVHG